jgi:hypothetical protein
MSADTATAAPAGCLPAGDMRCTHPKQFESKNTRILRDLARMLMDWLATFPVDATRLSLCPQRSKRTAARRRELNAMAVGKLSLNRQIPLTPILRRATWLASAPSTG